MLGTITTNSSDVPVLGELPNSGTDIRAAVGRIENPELRLIDRMFWFHSDKASLGEKKTFIQHDSLLHDLFNTFSDTVDEACVQKWTKTLQAWHQFVSDDTYWEQIGELEVEGGFEPAAYPSEIEGLRSRALELAAEPLIVAGREAVGRNDAEAIHLILAGLGELEGTAVGLNRPNWKSPRLSWNGLRFCARECARSSNRKLFVRKMSDNKIGLPALRGSLVFAPMSSLSLLG